MLKEILGIIKKVLICIIIALVITMNDYGSICRIVYDLSKGKITGAPYSIAVDDGEEEEDEEDEDEDDISESLKDYTKGLEYEYNDISKNYEVLQNNYGVTFAQTDNGKNSDNEPLINITATKTWGENETKPEKIELQLCDDNVSMGNSYKITLNADNSWTAKWTGLLKYSSHEATVSGYNRNATYSPVEGVTLYANNSTVEIPEKVSKNGLSYTVTGIKPGVFNDVEGELPKIVVTYNKNTNKYNSTQKTEIQTDENDLLKTILVPVMEDYANVENVVLPKTITNISERTFKDCTNLVMISGTSEITTIGSSAFENCTSLSNISSFSKLSQIGANAFKNCTSLSILSITSTNEIEAGDNFLEGTDENLIIWTYNSTKLNEIEGINCILLDDFTFEEIRIELDEKDDPVLDENGKLKETTNIEKSLLGLKLTGYTGNYEAIEFFTELNEIGLISIGENVFKDNSSLNQILLPYTMYELGKSCFYGCTGLSDISIPDTIISIEDKAFYGCTGLEKIERISGVNYFGDEVFAECSNLEEIWIKSKNFKIGSNNFINDDINIKIYCYSSTDLYKNYGGCIAIDTLKAITIYQYPDKMDYRADKVEELDLSRTKN